MQMPITKLWRKEVFYGQIPFMKEKGRGRIRAAILISEHMAGPVGLGYIKMCIRDRHVFPDFQTGDEGRFVFDHRFLFYAVRN